MKKQTPNLMQLDVERLVSQTVPFMDLWRQHGPLVAEFNEELDVIMRQSAFTLGDSLEKFEQSFADYCGSKYAVGVNSGTDALHFALLSCGIGPGDEVITVNNTFIATAEAISMCGAKPIFVDIDDQTLNMDPAQVLLAVTPNTRAIVPVHLFGRAAPMDRINSIAARFSLAVIEDACQAHGAMLGEQRIGTISDAGCFSFYPGKNLGAMGDGGIVVTDNKEIAEHVRSLRHHGQKNKNVHDEVGYCSRLDNLQAALLNTKLRHLDDWNWQRQEAAAIYDALLDDTKITIPAPADKGSHVYHLYVIRTEQRDALREYLSKRGIQSGIHYPIPLHMQPAYKSLGYQVDDFPVAEKAANEIISLPMFPGITKEELKIVGNEIKRFAG